MNGGKNAYRKPRRFRKGALATAGTLLLAASVSVIGIAAYYIATEGWQYVADWFAGKWFCLIAVILLFGGTLAFWVYYLAKIALKTRADDE